MPNIMSDVLGFMVTSQSGTDESQFKNEFVKLSLKKHKQTNN